MSGTDNKILTNLSQRLSIQDAATLKNSEVYLRTFQSKGGLKNINDLAKAVLCLNLAAYKSGVAFDKETAVKLSGLKKSAYENNLHIIEKVLDLDKPLTIAEVCVQLNCTCLKDLAEDVYSKYKIADRLNRDFSHPQYVAAAVYAACKLQNVKVQKSQFVSLSRLKSLQWKELETEFFKFVENAGFKTIGKKKGMKTEGVPDQESCAKESAHKARYKKDAEDEIEDYETWKARILKEAQEEILRQRSNS